MKKYVYSSAETTKMLYDGYDCVADYNSGDTLQRYYVTPMLDENLLVYDDAGDDEEYFYLHDGLGTVRQILDASQNVENQYDYEGFGTSLGSTESIYNRFRYTGREIDTETNSVNSTALYYYRARTYDSTIGSFTSRDPIKKLNLYNYSVSNPIMYSDPLGLEEVKPDWYIIGMRGFDLLVNVMGDDILYGYALQGLNAADRSRFFDYHSKSGTATAYDIIGIEKSSYRNTTNKITFGPHIANKGYKSGTTGFTFGIGTNQMNIQYGNVASTFNAKFKNMKTQKRCFRDGGMCCEAKDTLRTTPEDIVKQLQTIVAAQVLIHELIHFIGLRNAHTGPGSKFWKYFGHKGNVSQHTTKILNFSKGSWLYKFMTDEENGLGISSSVIDTTLTQSGFKNGKFSGPSAFHFMEALMWNQYKNSFIGRRGYSLIGSSNGDVTYSFDLHYDTVIICDDRVKKQSFKYEIAPYNVPRENNPWDPVSKNVSLRIPSK